MTAPRGFNAVSSFKGWDMSRKAARRRDDTDWCILRTSGGRTLNLARSLAEAGFDVWTPTRTIKRPHGKRDEKGRRANVELDVPILPTFVFARAISLSTLTYIAADPTHQHPPFSIFTHAGRVPLIGANSVAGLQEEERAAAELIDQLRAAENRDEERRIKSAAMRTKREREKALRAERRDFAEGAVVSVADQPSLAGMTGVIVSSDGRTAVVAFGGSLTMVIEAWRLAADAVGTASIAA
jgi:hypothetical protein